MMRQKMLGYLSPQGFLIKKGIVRALPEAFSVDTKISLDKWEEAYRKSLVNKDYEKQKEEYDRQYLKDTLDQILADYRLKKA